MLGKTQSKVFLQCFDELLIHQWKISGLAFVSFYCRVKVLGVDVSASLGKSFYLPDYAVEFVDSERNISAFVCFLVIRIRPLGVGGRQLHHFQNVEISTSSIQLCYFFEPLNQA